jgi:hypothetical protein
MTKEEFYKETNPAAHGPLEGIVVLEACTTYAGPVAAAELADLGAEVIKCELPVTGDVCRLFGPRVPHAPEQDGGAPFLSINRQQFPVERKQAGERPRRRVETGPKEVNKHFGVGGSHERGAKRIWDSGVERLGDERRRKAPNGAAREKSEADYE